MFWWWIFKAAPSMALSESGGTIRRRTLCLATLSQYESWLGRVANTWTLCEWWQRVHIYMIKF